LNRDQGSRYFEAEVSLVWLIDPRKRTSVEPTLLAATRTSAGENSSKV
jgi:hypothetical protein